MTEIIGILNLTPDSFSGDGVKDPVHALTRIEQMSQEGAAGIDIGAESTRPGAVLLSAEEEWKRLGPIVKTIVERIDKVKFSIDTRYIETVEKILHAIPEKYYSSLFINDVSGDKDKRMAEVVKKSAAKLIVMHSLSIPADPKVTIPENENVVEVVYQWARGVIKEYGNSIVIDPGIGFGKTARQSLSIIKNIDRIQSLGASVMVGHSRKSFLSLFTNKKAEERDPETLAISNYLISKNVDYLRVHDVRSHTSLLKIRETL